MERECALATPFTCFVAGCSTAETMWLRLLPSPSTTPTASHTKLRRPRRVGEEVRQRAMVMLSHFVMMLKAKARLLEMKRNASSTQIQSVYRGASVRRQNGPVLMEWRRILVMQQYASAHRVDLAALPSTHRVHLAARRIQMLVRRRIAHTRFSSLAQGRAAARIQRAYHSYRLREYVRTTHLRQQLLEQRVVAATRIQALVRGHQIRQRVVASQAERRRAIEVSLAPKHREARTLRVQDEANALARRITEAQKRAEELEVLRLVLSTENPNTTLVDMSTQHTFEARIRPQERRSATEAPLRSVKVTPASAVHDTFRPSPQLLCPSRSTITATEPQPPTIPPVSMRKIRTKAVGVARSRLRHHGERAARPWEADEVLIE